MTNAHYYRLSPARRWRKIRFERIELAGGVCEVCYVNAATQVHHVSYAGGDWPRLMDLRAVCDRCHARIHGVLEPANDNEQLVLELAAEAAE